MNKENKYPWIQKMVRDNPKIIYGYNEMKEMALGLNEIRELMGLYHTIERLEKVGFMESRIIQQFGKKNKYGGVRIEQFNAIKNHLTACKCCSTLYKRYQKYVEPYDADAAFQEELSSFVEKEYEKGGRIMVEASLFCLNKKLEQEDLAYIRDIKEGITERPMWPMCTRKRMQLFYAHLKKFNED